MRIMVVDLEMGNIRSLTAALTYLGADHIVSDDPAEIESATHVILPGVGAFDAAMQKIAELSLAEGLLNFGRELAKPLLGICLGMQLLAEGSDEGKLPGLGFIPGQFRLLKASPDLSHKVPHVGVSAVYGYQEIGVFKNIGTRADFYFTHSFALASAGEELNNVAYCDHDVPFVAAFQYKNLCGVQFHPEKSQSTGLRLISNFLELS